MTRLVIFDMDGTLIDSQAHIIAAMTAAFQSVEQQTPKRSTLLSVVGLSLPSAFEVLIPNLPASAYTQMQNAYRAHSRSISLDQSAPLYSGARVALERLSQRSDVALAVATGASERGMMRALKANSVDTFFTSMQCADGHPSKPNPSMAQACMSQCGATAEHTVVVGDTTYDMEMGQAARCASLGVLWGHHGREALLASGAHSVIETFEQLDAALDTIWKD
jgi:phosphoglycolate phosphatase